MKTFKTILFVILDFIVFPCASQTQVKQQPSLMPIVMVIGIDVSETMDGYPLWTESTIKNLCHIVAKRGTNAWICIKMIGDPSRDAFRRIEILKVPIIDSRATLSLRVRQRKEQEMITAQNEQNINKFIESISLARKGEMKTCINDFCAHSVTLLNEPQFSTFQKVLIIYSDGYEDSDGNNRTEPLNVSVSKDVSLIYIGWKNTEKLKHTGVNHEFADIEGFLSYINSLNE